LGWAEEKSLVPFSGVGSRALDAVRRHPYLDGFVVITLGALALLWYASRSGTSVLRDGSAVDAESSVVD
jgi:hypothetical protein